MLPVDHSRRLEKPSKSSYVRKDSWSISSLPDMVLGGDFIPLLGYYIIVRSFPSDQVPDLTSSRLGEIVNEEPGIMLPGHVFTIEPAIVEGEDGYGSIWPDGWTMGTRVRIVGVLLLRWPFDDERLIGSLSNPPSPHLFLGNEIQSNARSAQFEHTVLITETGVDILTSRPKDRLMKR